MKTLVRRRDDYWKRVDADLAAQHAAQRAAHGRSDGTVEAEQALLAKQQVVALRRERDALRAEVAALREQLTRATAPAERPV